MSALLDHIGIVGPELAPLEAAYRRLGFHLAPRCELVGIDDKGASVALGQSNSHLVFANSYVELTAVHGDIETHHLRDAIARYFGFHIVVLRTADAEATRSRLQQDGLTIDSVSRAGRAVSYPNAQGRAEFRWFRIADREAPEAFVCFVQHMTPELVFDSALNCHPNGAQELVGITLCVDDPFTSAERLTRLCAGQLATDQNGNPLLQLAQSRIRCVTPTTLGARYPGITVPALPFAAGFTLACPDLTASLNYFQTQAVPCHQGDGYFWLPPGAAGGAVIEFQQE